MRLRTPMLMALLSLLLPIGAGALTFTHLAGSTGGPGFFDGPGAAARFSRPAGITSDAAGNFYVADIDNQTVRKITPAGDVTTLAGLANAPGTADGFRAHARFRLPRAITIDPSGNLYLLDVDVVRKITPAGQVTTVAQSYLLEQTSSLAAGADGTVYLGVNSTIKKLGPNGDLLDVAGDSYGSPMSGPLGLAFDASTNTLLVTDYTDQNLRRVTIPGGAISTIAGAYRTGGHVNGNGIAAQFDHPHAVSVAADGSMWVAESAHIRTVSTLGDVGDATPSLLIGIEALTVSAADGKVYLADANNSAIRKLDGATVTTFAGAIPEHGFTNGTGSDARFYMPGGLASYAAAGGTEVYVADTENHAIRKVTVPGGVVTTFAGATGWSGADDGPAAGALFFHPRGLAVDPSNGTLYVADSYNHVIRAVTQGGVVSTYAGNRLAPGSSNGDRLTAASFIQPTALAIDGTRLYIADGYPGSYRIRVLDRTTGILGDFIDAATGFTVAFPTEVQTLAVDSSGTVWAATGGMITRITQAGVRSVFAGHAGSEYDDPDGTGAGASFALAGPEGLAIDGAGNGFIVENFVSRVRTITGAGVVTTISRPASTAGASIDGTGSEAHFRYPRAVVRYGATGAVVLEEWALRLGTPELPDVATIDNAIGSTGVTRQLGTAPNTATSWEWSIIRRPAGSTATLSSTTARTPSFTPDVADLYVFRCVATSASGSSITTISLQATGAATSLLLTTPSYSVTAGVPFAVTVQVRDSLGNAATGFTGTVSFATNADTGTVPAPVTFTPADAGTKVVNGFVLRSVGAFTLHAGSTSPALGVNTQLFVDAGPAATLHLTAPAAPVVRGGTTAAFFLLMADAYGNLAGTYSGTLHFTSNDPLATLPADKAMHAGTLNFDVTFRSGGRRTVTATDTQNGALTGTATVTVEVPNLFGDQDGDGRSDIYWRNVSNGANAVWLMNGTSFSAVTNLPPLPNTSYRIAAIADFNRDGQPDIVWRNAATGANAIWLMQNASVLAVVNLPPLTNPDYAIGGSGDFNGDGHPDLLWRNGVTGANAIWLLDGTNILSIANLPGVGNPDYRMEGSADFNADGKADVLWRNAVTGANAVWLMEGTAFTSILNLPALPNVAYRVGSVADFNGDAKPDIVWRNATTGANAIWTLDGATLLSVADLPGLVNSSYEMGGPR